MFEYKGMRQSGVIEAQLWWDLFFYENWFLFAQSGFYQQEFIVHVIPALFSFFMEEFIDFGFQVCARNFDFVRGPYLKPT